MTSPSDRFPFQDLAIDTLAHGSRIAGGLGQKLATMAYQGDDVEADTNLALFLHNVTGDAPAVFHSEAGERYAYRLAGGGLLMAWHESDVVHFAFGPTEPTAGGENFQPVATLTEYDRTPGTSTEDWIEYTLQAFRIVGR